jgi:hypothetical protein
MDTVWTVRDRNKIPVGARFIANFQTGPGAHPASCTKGTGSFAAVKRSGRCADHPPPSSAEGTKGYSYTSNHPLGQFKPVMGLIYLCIILYLVRLKPRPIVSVFTYLKYFFKTCVQVSINLANVQLKICWYVSRKILHYYFFYCTLWITALFVLHFLAWEWHFTWLPLKNSCLWYKFQFIWKKSTTFYYTVYFLFYLICCLHLDVTISSITYINLNNIIMSKVKAIPLQALTGPESLRSLRLPDFKKIGTWRW